MIQTIYPNSAKDFTVGQALEMYKEGVSIAVNDGRDLIVTFGEDEENEE